MDEVTVGLTPFRSTLLLKLLKLTVPNGAYTVNKPVILTGPPIVTLPKLVARVNVLKEEAANPNVLVLVILPLAV